MLIECGPEKNDMLYFVLSFKLITLQFLIFLSKMSFSSHFSKEIYFLFISDSDNEGEFTKLSKTVSSNIQKMVQNGMFNNLQNMK